MSLREQTYLKWLHSSIVLPVGLLIIIFVISLWATTNATASVIANFGSGDAILLGALLLIGVVADVDQHFASSSEREYVLVSMRENCFSLSLIYLIVFAIMKWVSLSSDAAKAMANAMPTLSMISLACLLLAVLLAIRIKRKLVDSP